MTLTVLTENLTPPEVLEHSGGQDLGFFASRGKILQGGCVFQGGTKPRVYETHMVGIGLG